MTDRLGIRWTNHVFPCLAAFQSLHLAPATAHPILVPAPSISNDVSKVRAFCRPSKQFACALGFSHQNWWISRSARTLAYANLSARDGAGRLDHVPHGGALPARKVHRDCLAPIEQIL